MNSNNNFDIPSRELPAFSATLPILFTSFVACFPSNFRLSGDATVLATCSKNFPAETVGSRITGNTCSRGLPTWWFDGVWLEKRMTLTVQKKDKLRSLNGFVRRSNEVMEAYYYVEEMF